ncbi:MAG: hypothetical protein ACPLW6_00010 [Desulfurella sp.]|jgi:hypothetical protein|uniref:hypothetical protein n=1 Tax=Desulfurella TaxID=33001 RepID=UPI0003E0913D|nr:MULTISPECIES: hypothetical protein [Desulfurella]AHF98175.1 hypothetical protein DESACE_08285 [Desulfurella acetivorans A63]PMP63629.1 MAG: hypothetical protein C0192_07360 [Desulfurella multipotens]PMP93304.1 MAG: hypothetical protein C0173_00870 [Desulfurella sp.]HEX12958.1 hypothetical protein [Desulfurella acetivorans]
MDDETLAIEKIDALRGISEKEESFYRQNKQPQKKQSQKKTSNKYKKLFLKKFKKNLDNFEIDLIIKDGKNMLRFYSKKNHKEFFQDYDCICEILNFCPKEENQIGVNIDINV